MTSSKPQVVTPTIPCRYLSSPTQRVWLKHEYMQPTGSFKIRGVQRACAAEAANGARRLLIASGGNAGIAVAYCARALGVSCLVVVPESASMLVKVMLRNLGAEVVVRGRTLEDADAVMGGLRSTADGVIHPDHNPFILDGYASLIREAKMQMQMHDPDAVVVAVGGGGLMSGVLQGMHFVGWSQVPLIACETLGAHTLALAMAAGHSVGMPRLTSVVSALSARSVSEAAFAWTLRHNVVSEVVTELEAVRAARGFADHYNKVIDPSCGAVVAALGRRRPDELAKAQEVLVVICGGTVTSYRDLISMEEALCSRNPGVLEPASSPPEAYPKDIGEMLRRLSPIVPPDR
ncbi:pyridoxal-phosphate dependent enzyme [Paucibacter sp. PLA-PC-4]|uniref:pyridoxal-phosphate dependent enzyme n=1 Tax=Paucibacter sp. PLA-PC-4 TaxID=2993655 RepID=UPI00224A5874|nr:pyridoxal-phosphate dependent enzyme [Paucibacter sp. PLA-PC-4]MCX2865712.1 pyridoxal-phosphate dependent enzyme [Paucibacter sp. PLA-PC-4]